MMCGAIDGTTGLIVPLNYPLKLFHVSKTPIPNFVLYLGLYILDL